MEHQPSQTSGTGAPEQALGEGEGIARMILDSIPGMVALLTPSGEVEFVNNQILEYCGKTLGELKQWGTNDTIHPDDLPGVIGAFTGSITSGKPYEITQRLRRFDGAYRWFQNSGFPLRDTDARILHWCVLLTDVHERNGAEEALRQSEARLVEAKRELQLTVDTIPALAWSARPDGSADFFNQHYLEYVGLPLEEVRDWRWTAAVHPDDLGGLARAWERILDAKAGGEAEARLRRSDGVYRWFLLRAQPLRDEKDNIVRWYGINTDIEDRKGAEAELRRAYDSFADAQRLSRTGSFITDLVADDHNWSDEAFRIFEFEPKSKVTVQRIRAMVHPDDLASFDSVIERGSKGEEVDFFFRILTSRGAVKHVRGLAHVVERVAGRPMFVGALQDVTETKVGEETLNRLRSELAHAARAMSLGVLTASIAHEVNQPLSGIITNASTCLRMLATDPPNIAGARETARRTIRDGNRASEVISRLRDLFRKKEFSVEAVDLNEAAHEVIALSSQELQRHRIAVQSDFQDDLPKVIGDRVQLQQVILNFLLNASDAIKNVSDRPRRIFVRTACDDEGAARVSVCDTGVGVPPDRLGELFDAFYTTKADGMGIGLSVSRSIIERHNGRIWAAPNDDGPGATFAFSIPASAERERERLHAGIEKLDLEPAIDDGSRLPD